MRPSALLRGVGLNFILVVMSLNTALSRPEFHTGFLSEIYWASLETNLGAPCFLFPPGGKGLGVIILWLRSMRGQQVRTRDSLSLERNPTTN